MGLDPVTVEHVPEDEDQYAGYHSEDHPFYFHPEQNTAYVGPLGKYHDDCMWPAKLWRGHFTHGRIDPHGHVTWYEPSELSKEWRQHAADHMAQALGAQRSTDITPESFFDDEDWQDEEYRQPADEVVPGWQHQGRWTATAVVERIPVPGESNYGFHSNDRPYFYNTESGKLYTGDVGTFHADLYENPVLQQLGDVDPKAIYYMPWIKGRFSESDGKIVHHSVPGYGSQEAHALRPHHKAIEEALGVGPDIHYDYGELWDDSEGLKEQRKEEFFRQYPEMEPFRRSNILDPIHDTLDPRVWDDEGALAPKLKPGIKKWLIREIHEQASHFHPNPEKWLRLVVTGSLTTFQYSEDSDLDVSLFVSPHFLPEWERGQLIGLMVNKIDGKKVPGTPFPVQAFVVPKNISHADLYQPGLRSGYDVEQDNWLVPPDRSRVADIEKEYNKDYVYALESADKMERLLRYDPPKAVKYWHQIHARRRRDHAAGKGDFSQANIVYKMLANRGLFPDISEASGEYIAALS